MADTERFTLEVDGIPLEITNPNKPLWQHPTVTKAQYLERLIMLSPYLLPYCKNRYLTTIRYPHGAAGEFFYQKNAPKPTPQFVHTAELNGIRYVNLDQLATLIWLGNLACLEFHPSFHYIDQTTPAEWVIDMDPSQEKEPRLAEAACIVGDTLRGLGIQAVPKTSGATGIQIYVPIEQKYTFEQLRSLGEFIARFLVEKHPDLFTIERLKKDRGNKIYIDYLQHWPGKTLSAPYTPRARPNAPISTPLEWSELSESSFEPSRYNLFTIEERLKEKGDIIRSIAPQSIDEVLGWLKQRGKQPAYNF